MRVVVIGATGNVGTSVLESLEAESAVHDVVAVARRAPSRAFARTTFVAADVASFDLVPLLRGADAVVHLAWLIQPGRSESITHSVNVAGSERVFRAALEAKVPTIVYASSVGAYSPGPKDRLVDESWPTGGIRSSFYSRHKVAVERALDHLEREQPELRVVRMRPALIFKADAATEIRRLFAGPFLPRALLRPELIPFVPDVPRLRFQAVHSLDVGDAYRQTRVERSTWRRILRSTARSWPGCCTRARSRSRGGYSGPAPRPRLLCVCSRASRAGSTWRSRYHYSIARELASSWDGSHAAPPRTRSQN